MFGFAVDSNVQTPKALGSLDEYGLLAVGSPERYTVPPTEQEIAGILARTVVAALDRIARGRGSDTT